MNISLNKVLRSYQTLFFVGIIVIAIFLRFWKLGEIPDGINRDEASLGYTAYSLLQTGADEYGQKWPVNIKSFGDWKLPLYVYLSIPFISVFGLNPFSIRILSALAGVLITIIGYFLTRLLVKKWDAPYWLPLLVAFSLAISPWSVHLSRIAYEANVAMAFCMAGVTFWLASTVNKKPWLVILSGVCFGLTMIGYHAFQLFTPLIIAWTAWILRTEVKSFIGKYRLISAFSVIVFLLPILFLFVDKAIENNQTKYSGISIFSEERLQSQQAEVNGVLSPKGLSFLQPFYSSRPVLLSQTFIRGMFSMMNPDFLFLRGGSHGSHNIPGVGNMHWYAVLTLAISLLYFLKKKRIWQRWILGWIVLASVAPLLTIEPNHSIRFFPAILGLEIMSSYGIGLIGSYLKKVQPFLILVFIFSIFHLFVAYFILFPALNADRWPWFSDDLVQAVYNRSEAFPKVLMQGESSSPYVYFLFFSPDRIIKDGEEFIHYPPTEEGFEHVQQLGKTHFGRIVWSDIEKAQEPVLLVVQPKEVPGDKFDNPRYKVVQEISRPNSLTSYLIMEYR